MERVVFLLFSRLSFLVFVVLRAARGLNPFESVSVVSEESFRKRGRKDPFLSHKVI